LPFSVGAVLLLAEYLGVVREVDHLISNLTIPEIWYEMIAAYYMSDDGMAEFERESITFVKN